MEILKRRLCHMYFVRYALINKFICYFSWEKCSSRHKSSKSKTSRLSTDSIGKIVDKLMVTQHRSSTASIYLSVWRQFNDFFISLDIKPDLWEHRTTLFIGFLIDKGMQSNTIKSYVSAIKKTLVMDGYNWNDNLVLVRSLAKACRIINDTVRTRLPVHCSLLEMILFEVQRYFSSRNQFYLETLYKTMFAIAYYGLMRVGEITRSPHVLRARNVHLAINKDKLLLVLYSSKTHDKSSRPQKIKITSNRNERSGSYVHRYFCPFVLMRRYMHLRGDYETENEQFFIFRDNTLVSAQHLWNVLKLMINNIGLDNKLYGMHSF